MGDQEDRSLDRPIVPDTEEVLRSAGQTTMLIAGTRPGRWLAALPAIGGS
jgi:hypothetical protein